MILLNVVGLHVDHMRYHCVVDHIFIFKARLAVVHGAVTYVFVVCV